MPRNLSDLGIFIKLLFSGYSLVIAISHATAMVQILFTGAMTRFALSLADTVYGDDSNRSDSPLENEPKGSRKIIPPKHTQRICHGLGETSSAGENTPDIKICNPTRQDAELGILLERGQFATLVSHTQQDSGTIFASILAPQIFGIAFIFTCIGGIFCLSSGILVKLKSAAVPMPDVFLHHLDITTWRLTKHNPHRPASDNRGRWFGDALCFHAGRPHVEHAGDVATIRRVSLPGIDAMPYGTIEAI